jgi:hypothetical protein
VRCVIPVIVFLGLLSGCSSFQQEQRVEEPVNMAMEISKLRSRDSFNTLRAEFDEDLQSSWISYQTQRCNDVLNGELASRCALNERWALALFLSLPSAQVSEDQFAVAKAVYEMHQFERMSPSALPNSDAYRRGFVGDRGGNPDSELLTRAGSPMVYYVRSIREAVKASRHGLL